MARVCACGYCIDPTHRKETIGISTCSLRFKRMCCTSRFWSIPVRRRSWSRTSCVSSTLVHFLPGEEIQRC